MRIAWATGVDGGLQATDDAAGLDLAWPDFHEASKLPAVLARSRSADYATTPQEAFVVSRAFRQQPGPDRIPLEPCSAQQARLPEVMTRRRSRRDLDRPVPFGDLATVLVQALGPTQVLVDESSGAPTARRAWPSAGGLYPLDAYLVARSVRGLGRGCYHVNTIAGLLEPVRGRPDVDDVLREGWFWQDFVTGAAAVVVLVAVFERTVAKYGERGYRFALLDAGHAAQNLLLVATQQLLPSIAVGGFDDDALAAALGLDGLHEAVIHSVALGGPDPEETP
jgi:SagB-type dehydrogenase family enzyme